MCEIVLHNDTILLIVLLVLARKLAVDWRCPRVLATTPLELLEPLYSLWKSVC